MRAALPRERLADPAVDATLRAAAPWQRARAQAPGMAVSIHGADLREKVRVRRAGCSILFVVDASGSMRVCQRMVEAKTAVLSLLADAYHRRDRVGLVAFRGGGARVVLPLTGSIELARRSLEVLPSGGLTPLSEGIRVGRQALEHERARRPGSLCVLVILSDGRANVSPRGDPGAAALAEARAVRRASIPLLFVDTDATWQDPGLGMRICSVAGGRYLPVGSLAADRIVEVIEASVPGR